MTLSSIFRKWKYWSHENVTLLVLMNTLGIYVCFKILRLRFEYFLTCMVLCKFVEHCNSRIKTRNSMEHQISQNFSIKGWLLDFGEHHLMDNAAVQGFLQYTWQLYFVIYLRKCNQKYYFSWRQSNMKMLFCKTMLTQFWFCSQKRKYCCVIYFSW